MKISGIYKIVNKVNGKYYVGSSKNIQNRCRSHFNYLRKNKHPNDYLQKSWNKHGENNFKYIVVEKCKLEDRLIIEQKYLHIAKQNKDKTYNLNFKSVGGPDFNEYSINKIRNSKLGNKNPMFGKHCQNFGKHLSDETKKRISESKKIIYSVKENNPFYGKHHSDETKLKMSNLKKGKYIGCNNPSYKNTTYNFINIKTNERFNGTSYEFKTKYKITPSQASYLTTGKKEKIGNWIIS